MAEEKDGLLEFMTPKQLAEYWVNRRRMAWASLFGIFAILGLDAKGIKLEMADTVGWIFATVIIAYFAGNAIVEGLEKLALFKKK